MRDIYQYSFEKLNAWQNAREFVLEIYEVTSKFPKHEKYSLTDQIRRGAISIVANLAEGSSRISSKDQAHFTNISYSSLMEVLSHFYLALDLHYINENIFDNIKRKIYEIFNQLNLRNLNEFFSLHSTKDIIKAAEAGRFPDQIMMTFHPQRWTDQPWPWVKGLI